MKITKVRAGIFLTTFFVGYVSFLPTKKEGAPVSTANSVAAAFSVGEAKPELEIIEKTDDLIVDTTKKPFKTGILEAGEDFSGNEIDAKNGETWLGLFKDKENYFLHPVKIKVSRVSVAEKDDFSSEIKKSVSVSTAGKPLFLLKNFNASKEKSPVTTLFRGATRSDILERKKQFNFNSYELLTKLNKDFAENYEIGGNGYTLKVIKAKNKNNAEILALILEGAGKRQIVHAINPKESSDLGYLFWAGDLDSDGKPDFYLSLHENDNVSARILFLSSKAGEGKLIKAVAALVTYVNC